MIVRVSPFAALMAFTSAVDTAAPEGSRTTPPMEPVGDCPAAIAIDVKNSAAVFAVSSPRTICLRYQFGTVALWGRGCPIPGHGDRDSELAAYPVAPPAPRGHARLTGCVPHLCRS